MVSDKSGIQTEGLIALGAVVTQAPRIEPVLHKPPGPGVGPGHWRGRGVPGAGPGPGDRAGEFANPHFPYPDGLIWPHPVGRRLEPQITVGLLTDAAGFPSAVNAFEGNKAETATILPVIEAFRKSHALPDSAFEDGQIFTQKWPAGPTDQRRDLASALGVSRATYYRQSAGTAPAEDSAAGGPS